MNKDYSKIYSEVIGFLDYLPEEQYIKIPNDLIRNFKWHMNYSHTFKYDPNKSLTEQGMSHDAKILILKIFNKYFATDEQKNKIKSVLAENKEIYLYK